MRIIAGEAKGRELLAPKGMNTRPTLAKVKEAMFGMIQFDIEGAYVLDLFSGSGSLGIEALSRGARRAVFCDSGRDAYNTVRANLKKLGYEERASVCYSDSIRLLGREYLACLHVHDNDGVRDLHWVPYRGVIDWADFSLALHEIGYEGTLSLETNVSKKLPPPVRPDWEKALTATARALTMAPKVE